METQSPLSRSGPEPDPNSLTQLGLGTSVRPGALTKTDAAALSPEELELDMRLESELVLLVSNLDYVRSLLEETIAQRPPAACLRPAIELLKTVCGFAEQYPEADAGGATLGKAQATLIWMQQLDRQVNEGGLQRLWGLLHKPRFSDEECYRLFGRVRVEVPDLIEQFFTLFSTAFRSPEMARQWTQTYGLFLTDLKDSFGKLAV